VSRNVPKSLLNLPDRHEIQIGVKRPKKQTSFGLFQKEKSKRGKRKPNLTNSQTCNNVHWLIRCSKNLALCLINKNNKTRRKKFFSRERWPSTCVKIKLLRMKSEAERSPVRFHLHKGRTLSLRKWLKPIVVAICVSTHSTKEAQIEAFWVSTFYTRDFHLVLSLRTLSIFYVVARMWPLQVDDGTCENNRTF